MDKEHWQQLDEARQDAYRIYDEFWKNMPKDIKAKFKKQSRKEQFAYFLVWTSVLMHEINEEEEHGYH